MGSDVFTIWPEFSALTHDVTVNIRFVLNHQLLLADMIIEKHENNVYRLYHHITLGRSGHATIAFTVRCRQENDPKKCAGNEIRESRSHCCWG